MNETLKLPTNHSNKEIKIYGKTEKMPKIKDNNQFKLAKLAFLAHLSSIRPFLKLYFTEDDEF